MKFKKIYVEITNVCNLACDFCVTTPRAKAFMTVADFAAVVRNIRPHTNYVYLHVLGEPLLHPHLGALLDICHDNGLKAAITTNGTLIGDADIVRPALRQVNFSMHSVSQNHMNPHDYLSRILAFIPTCHDKLYVNFRFWNKGAKDAASVALLRRIQAHFGYAGDLTNEALLAQGVKVHPMVYVQQNTPFTWPHKDGAEIFTHGKCYGLRDHVAILVDGTVVPCCLDADGAIALGNIFTLPLADIVAQDRVTAMKNGFGCKRPLEPFCRTCGFALRLNTPILETNEMN